jgi:TetR/AcrR family transcriptional regulator, cholesterol catabolism regulator
VVAGVRSGRTLTGFSGRTLFTDAVASGELRPGLHPDLAQPLIIGILNWAAEWWSPKRSTIDEVVATAPSIVRHGIAAEGPH